MSKPVVRAKRSCYPGSLLPLLALPLLIPFANGARGDGPRAQERAAHAASAHAAHSPDAHSAHSPNAHGAHDPNAHAREPIKRTEHFALLDLARDGRATHWAVKSGPWGTPDTWKGGSLPGKSARIVIPREVTVTVDREYDGISLDWIRIDGVLRFDPRQNTSLKVVTIVGNTMSHLEIGNEKARVEPNRRARIFFADRGPRDDRARLEDPFDLGGGMIIHGSAEIWGTKYTSHAKPDQIPRRGDRQIRLAAIPKGWKVGDRLLLPGLSLERVDDELRTITGVSPDRLTFSLDLPLAHNHGGIYGYGEAVPVGNLTRNVIFESENLKETSRRAHLMFMHTQEVRVDSARFVGLGRTDAQRLHTITRVDSNGVTFAGSDQNTQGRYAVHFHLRSGATYQQRPFTIRHCAVEGSPKHGIVNHGGYGLIEENVTYRCNGSHIFTENGSEIGLIRGNLVVRSEGSPDSFRPQRPPTPSDFGFRGHGIWLQSGGVRVVDTVAVGHSGAAFELFSEALADESPHGPHATFLAQNLEDPTLARKAEYLDPGNVPFYFARNTGLASKAGIVTTSHNLFAVIHDSQSLIKECRFVNNGQGWSNSYTRQVTVENTQFIGADPRQGSHYIGISGNVETANIRLRRVRIDGYTQAYSVPAHGRNEIKDCEFNGYTHAIDVAPPWGGELIMERLKFGASQPGAQAASCITLHNDLTSRDPKVFPLYVQPHVVKYNGRCVYYEAQSPDATPFRDAGPQLDGQSNRALWDRYRLAVGGRLAPAALTPSPDIVGGSLGPDVPFEPRMARQEPMYGWVVRPVTTSDAAAYVARIVIDGLEYSSTPVTLLRGWNVVTIKTASGISSIVVQLRG